MGRIACSVLAVLFLASILSRAQTPPASDPQALAIAAQAMASMTGGAPLTGYQDVVATGKMTIADTTFGIIPVTIKTLGTTKVRLEVQLPKGKNVRILNDGRAVLFQSSGIRRELLWENTMGERAAFFPVFSLLAEYAQSSVETTYLGTDKVDSGVADVVAINLVPPANAPDSADFRKRTQSVFYIDRTTAQVVKLRYQSAAENDSALFTTEEIVYSDYRNVNGMMVPFRQDSYTDGQPSSVLILDNVQFNVGLSIAEFDLNQESVL